MQRSALCRSRRELSNEYLFAKIGVDTAENEPLNVWGKIQFIIYSPPYSQVVVRRVGPQLFGGSRPVSGEPAAQTLVGTRSNGDARKHFRDEACRSHPQMGICYGLAERVG